MSKAYTVEGIYNRTSGVVTSPVRVTNTVVTDGRARWCVTRYESGEVTVRRAQVADNVDPNSLPMRESARRRAIIRASL